MWGRRGVKVCGGEGEGGGMWGESDEGVGARGVRVRLRCRR